MNVGLCLSAYRHERGLGVRALAKIIGTSSATLSRIERGEGCDSRTLAKVLLWLLT
jgi:DNA-binding XRE family transcriptional regulator